MRVGVVALGIVPENSHLSSLVVLVAAPELVLRLIYDVHLNAFVVALELVPSFDHLNASDGASLGLGLHCY